MASFVSIIDEMGGTYSKRGEDKSIEDFLVRNHMGRNSLRWKDVVLGLREMECEVCGMDIAGSQQGPVAGFSECCDEPNLHMP